MATCYRHPSRETGVSCSNCDRPICPDCMTPTNVGMRCPECAKQKSKVRTVRSGALGDEPRVTMAIIVVCVIMFLASGSFNVGAAGGNDIYSRFVLFGPAIHFDHDYWRLVTSGFL